MLKRNNSVAMLGSYLDACALWRLYMPHLNMPGSSFALFDKGVHYDQLAEKDIVIVQRCCTSQQYEMINTFHNMCMKVVYDLDDNMWNIPASNPAAAILGRLKEGFGHCMQNVDVVTVSTKTLANVVRKNVKNLRSVVTGKEIPIVVVENRIDMNYFAPPMPVAEGKRLKVGWGGSTSHMADLAVMMPAIEAVAKRHPEVDFEFRGLRNIPESVASLPNVSTHIWLPVAEYAQRMGTWGWDIALAPLVDEDFAKSKSNIKMQEAGHMSIPCLASWVTPYANFCSKDNELKWLLCITASQWELKLETLINDAAQRQHYGQRMNAVTRKYFSFEKEHEGWKNLLSVVSSL